LKFLNFWNFIPQNDSRAEESLKVESNFQHEITSSTMVFLQKLFFLNLNQHENLESLIKNHAKILMYFNLSCKLIRPTDWRLYFCRFLGSWRQCESGIIESPLSEINFLISLAWAEGGIDVGDPMLKIEMCGEGDRAQKSENKFRVIWLSMIKDSNCSFLGLNLFCRHHFWYSPKFLQKFHDFQ